MKVMILAAGRGERMGELTAKQPKPLLKVAGRTLIEHLMDALTKQGFLDFVINLAYRGEQIKQVLGAGEQWGVNIQYSDEGHAALETGGGIHNALPLLGEAHFMVVNADVWTDFPFDTLCNKTIKKAHLVLVDNPSHHPTGDFMIAPDALAPNVVASSYEPLIKTYSGIGVYHPSFFRNEKAGAFPLAPVIRKGMEAGLITVEHYQGCWVDVGTPERLATVQKLFSCQ